MKFKFLKIRFIILIFFSLVVLIFVSIPLNLTIAKYQFPQPQAILTLGGHPDREEFAAKLASHNPTLPIWISTGSKDNVIDRIFNDAGISKNRYFSDRRATDTVTNFTTLIKDFKQKDIRHLYLITSDFHLPRSKAIAVFILGSQGITFTPIAIPSDREPEPQIKIIRDVGRSILWIFTRRTGASLTTKEKPS